MKCPRHFPRYLRTERTETKILTFYQCPECKKVSKSSKRIPVAKFKAPGKRLKPRSTKRQKQEAEYSKLRKQYLEEHPVCQVCGREASDQIHHQRGRSGPWLTDTSEFLASCGGCHHRIETEREWAAQQGYLKLRLTTDQLKDQANETDSPLIDQRLD